MMENGRVTSGIRSTGAEEKICLSLSNVVCWREVHFHGSSFLVRRLRGATMFEKLGMNFWQKFANPMKDQIPFTVVGGFHFLIPVEICKSREGPDPFHCCGGFPLLDHFKFLFIHLHFPLTYDQAQELHFWGIEHSFGQLNSQSMFLKALQNSLSLFVMEREVVLGVNSHVIHVDF